MTRGKWVLLRSLLGALGLLKFAFGVDSASLSVLTSANEISELRVCAKLCDSDLAGKFSQVFCTSRRQFTIQSNTVVDERDVVVGVDEARRDACPTTLFRHVLGLKIRNCGQTKDPDLRVTEKKLETSLTKICAQFCRNKTKNFPECREGNEELHRPKKNNESRTAGNIDVSDRSAIKILGPSTNANPNLVPRGAMTNTDVAGEPDGVDADVDFFKRVNGGRQWTPKEQRNDGGTDFDREKFCEIECARGNGGLACKCDIIP